MDNYNALSGMVRLFSGDAKGALTYFNDNINPENYLYFGYFKGLAVKGAGENAKDEEIFNSDGVVEEEIQTAKKVVKSPIVGTAYLASDPETKPFVSAGKKIKKGDTVMIVEAMKTMNHIPSPIDGVVKEICVEDGQPIEYDQVLIILE